MCHLPRKVQCAAMPLLQLGRHCPGRKPAPLALWCCLAILITVGLFLSARSEFVVPVRVPFTAMARPPGRSASHQAALASRAVMFSRNFREITRGDKFSSPARAMLVSFHPFRHQICIRKCLAMCSPTLDEPRMNRAAELGIATATAHLASPPLWSHYAAGFRCALWPCGSILCIGAQGCNPVSKGSILCLSDPTDLRHTWPRLLFQFQNKRPCLERGLRRAEWERLSSVRATLVGVAAARLCLRQCAVLFGRTPLHWRSGLRPRIQGIHRLLQRPDRSPAHLAKAVLNMRACFARGLRRAEWAWSSSFCSCSVVPGRLCFW